MFQKLPKIEKNYFFWHALIFFSLSQILLSPDSLFAQQGDSANTPSPVQQNIVEQYFECLNACSSSKIDNHFKCLDTCSYPVVHLEKQPNGKIIQETLTERKEVKAVFDEIIQERLQCYSETSSIHLRLRSCRKEYTRKIMKVAKQVNRSIRSTRRFKIKHGHRQLGRFVNCVRYCPVKLAICRGDVVLGRHEGSCDNREFDCLQQCFIDHYL